MSIFISFYLGFVDTQCCVSQLCITEVTLISETEVNIGMMQIIQSGQVGKLSSVCLTIKFGLINVSSSVTHVTILCFFFKVMNNPKLSLFSTMKILILSWYHVVIGIITGIQIFIFFHHNQSIYT